MNQGLPSSAADGLPPGSGEGLWQACVDQLAQELPQQQFNTWIKPLNASLSEDFSRIHIEVANRFKLDWIRAQYAGRLAALLQKLYGQAIQIDFLLAPKEAPPRSAAPRVVSEPDDLSPNLGTSTDVESHGFKNRINTSLRNGINIRI